MLSSAHHVRALGLFPFMKDSSCVGTCRRKLQAAKQAA